MYITVCVDIYSYPAKVSTRNWKKSDLMACLKSIHQFLSAILSGKGGNSIHSLARYQTFIPVNCRGREYIGWILPSDYLPVSHPAK